MDQGHVNMRHQGKGAGRRGSVVPQRGNVATKASAETQITDGIMKGGDEIFILGER